MPLVETGTLKARFGSEDATKRQEIPKVERPKVERTKPTFWEDGWVPAAVEKPVVVPPPVQWSPYDRSAA